MRRRDSGTPTTTAPRPRPQQLWVRVDIDQLPAQALSIADPSLPDVPFVVVRQAEESHKAAVFAVNAFARQAGASPGMPVFIARRKVGRSLRVIPRDLDAEEAVRTSLHVVFAQWTPEVAAGGAWGLLDLSGTPRSRELPYSGVGARLSEELKERSGLTDIAIGVSGSRVVAQILARQIMPDGVITCPHGDEQCMLAAMDADSLPGLASACRERAHAYGIDRVDQLLELDRSTLIRRFGREQGGRLYGLVRGLASDARRTERDEIEAETVLKADVNDDSLLLEAVRLTADKATTQLRHGHRTASAVRLLLVYSDNRRAQRTARLSSSTDAFSRIADSALALFAQLHVRRVGLKSIQVTLARTSPATGQRDLFDGVTQQKERRLGAALTDIRQRMGFDAVLPAGSLRLER